jgi:hypothetical protein
MRCAIGTIVCLALSVNLASAQAAAPPSSGKPAPTKPAGPDQAAAPAQKPPPAKPSTPATGAASRKKPTPAKRVPPARNTAPGLTTTLLARAGMLAPAEPAYTDVYGHGPVFGGELRIALKAWQRRLVPWVEGSYRSSSGSLTFTKEATSVKIVTVESGVLVRLSRGRLAPYAGAGVGYFMLDEQSTALGAVSEAKIGAIAAGGLAVRLTGRIGFDARVKYSTSRMQPAALKVDVGGLTADVGFGLRF